jgi:preprotein translocase subunit SecD
MNRRLLILGLSLCMVLAVTVSAGCGSKAPSLSAIAPTSGAAGSNISLTGRSLGGTQGGSSVMISTETADIRSWSDTQVVVMVPRDLKDGDYQVSVTTGSGTSNQLTFTVKNATSTSKTQTTQATKPTQPSQTSTASDAITAYMQSQGENIKDYVPQNTKVSASDPNWAVYDYQRFEGMGHLIFLVHNANGTWTVVATGDGQPLSPQANGAPADLTYP